MALAVGVIGIIGEGSEPEPEIGKHRGPSVVVVVVLPVAVVVVVLMVVLIEIGKHRGPSGPGQAPVHSKRWGTLRPTF